jgi:hypothetical protein
MKKDRNKGKPIKDGDSRLDKQDRSTTGASSPATGKNQNKFSIERGADVNRADDFRDAK